MARDPSSEFNASAYWKDRVVSGSDLGVVGHRSMGLAYNAQIYERRLEVLNELLERHVTRSVEELRVLDIDCGSGFYTSYWAERGVRDYVGIDIQEELSYLGVPTILYRDRSERPDGLGHNIVLRGDIEEPMGSFIESGGIDGLRMPSRVDDEIEPSAQTVQALMRWSGASRGEQD